MGINRREPPVADSKLVKGRRAGVEGSYGKSRGDKGVEKTVVPKNDRHDSGAEDGLPKATHSLYSKAVKNQGDSIGDKALTER